MADSYIDCEETQIYGKHFATVAVDLAATYPIFTTLATALHGPTVAVGVELSRVRASLAKRSDQVETKRDVLPAARKALVETSLWVRLHPEVKAKRFFPSGRTPRGSADKMLEGVRTCIRAFAGYESVPEAKSRRAALEKLERRLQAAIAGSKAARHSVTQANPALERARARWLRVYAGVKHLARGTFLLAMPEVDVDAFMKHAFADLAVVEAPRRKSKSTTAASRKSEVVSG